MGKWLFKIDLKSGYCKNCVNSNLTVNAFQYHNQLRTVVFRLTNDPVAFLCISEINLSANLK